jgi:CheY-like chemotaxis protein
MSKRILVVDDQEDLRGVLRDLLTGSGYTVIEAADGESGPTNRTKHFHGLSAGASPATRAPLMKARDFSPVPANMGTGK